ncbi:hypothetical protein ACS0TY_034686 [Phlomoides rotata]
MNHTLRHPLRGIVKRSHLLQDNITIQQGRLHKSITQGGSLMQMVQLPGREMCLI